MHRALVFALLLDLHAGESVGLAATEDIYLTIKDNFAGCAAVQDLVGGRYVINICGTACRGKSAFVGVQRVALGVLGINGIRILRAAAETRHREAVAVLCQQSSRCAALFAIACRSGKSNTGQLSVSIEDKGAYLRTVLRNEDGVGIGIAVGRPCDVGIVVTRSDEYLAIGLRLLCTYALQVLERAPYSVRLIVFEVVARHLHMDIVVVETAVEPAVLHLCYRWFDGIANDALEFLGIVECIVGYSLYATA